MSWSLLVMPRVWYDTFVLARDVVLEHVMVKTQPAAHGVRAVRPPSPHKIRPDKPYGLEAMLLRWEMVICSTGI